MWKYFMTLYNPGIVCKNILYIYTLYTYIDILYYIYFTCTDKFVTLRAHNICILHYVKQIDISMNGVRRMNLIYVQSV